MIPLDSIASAKTHYDKRSGSQSAAHKKAGQVIHLVGQKLD
ncbi:MAG: hypothetical protein ACI87E_001395 [Mariniblastus sp.]|jgi:hypothetical protein